MTEPTPTAATRSRIIDLLQRERLTAAEIAARLDVTHNAVRSHLAALERDGVIRPDGVQRGATRPSVVYALTREAQASRSRVYAPFAAQLVAVLGERMPGDALDGVMREVGRRIARTLPRLRGDLGDRVGQAAALLERLGAPNAVTEEEGRWVIRGHGCSLAEAVHAQPPVCRALEELVSELVEAPVRERCDREGSPRCRFEIGPGREAPRDRRESA